MAGRRLIFAFIVLFVLYENSYCHVVVPEDELISKRILEPIEQNENIQENVLRLSSKNNDKFNMQTPRFKSRRQTRPVIDPSKIDIAFAIDKYFPIGPRRFYLIKQFAGELIEYLPVFPLMTRVACVSLSARVKVEFNFKKYLNKECTMKAIRRIRYSSGKSSLNRALRFVREDLIFNSASGARSNAQKVLVVFTDGRVNDFERITIKRLKESGVIVIVVHTSQRRQTNELPSTGSEPDYVFSLDSSNILYQLVELLGGDASRQCRPGKIVYDQCRRRCRCVKGKLVRCCRVRTQFTEMSRADRQRYIEVVKTASKHPAYREKYEKLLTIHKTIFSTGIHQAVYFLPWHRWFVLQYENMLREIDCGVTVPYWESAEEANNALASDVWNTGNHGFGGNGTGTSNCVQDGPFKEGEWSVIQSAGGGCLKRNFNGRFPDCLTVREALLEFSHFSRFEDFEYFLHREFHDAVHCVIGGQMCTQNSASSPEFFLHHGFVDKLWSDWQKQSDKHAWNEHFTSQTSRMPSTEYLSKDLLDLLDQPGCVCVEYRDPGDEIYKTVNEFSRTQIKEIPRVPLPPYPESARKLFQVTDKDMQRMEKVREFLQPVNALREDALEGEDRVLGFRKKDLDAERERGFRRSKVDKEV